MRIVLTHPYCWPYVRRGTERNVEVWYSYLLSRGYDARLLSTYFPGTQARPHDSNKTLKAPLWFPSMGRLRLQPMHTFFFSVYNCLPALEPDIVHSFHFYDALAATLVRKRRKPMRVLMQMNGVPIPGVSCRRWLPPEYKLIRAAMRRADCRVVCSSFVRQLVQEFYGSDAHVLVPALDRALWPAGNGPRSEPAAVLAVANFDERRKGIRVLLRAFELLRHEMPTVELWLSGNLSPSVEKETLGPLPAELRSAITVFGLGRPEDLPVLYQKASVLALPSMWEPSGTVMMEAWLCGTPVVATRHGGLPEMFREGVGVLFDPKTDTEETTNAEGLAAALHEGIRLSAQPETRVNCRRHGETFTLETVGPQFERFYADLRNDHAG